MSGIGPHRKVTAVLLAASGSGGNMSFLILMVLFIGVAYFLLIRPQQRRARAVARMQSEIGPGDEILTIGGLYGIVESIDDESVHLQAAPGVSLRFRRNAIAQVVSQADRPAEMADPEVADAGTEAADHPSVDKND
jgi:preprotein translocase subunit YajC